MAGIMHLGKYSISPVFGQKQGTGVVLALGGEDRNAVFIF